MTSTVATAIGSVCSAISTNSATFGKAPLACRTEAAEIPAVRKFDAKVFAFLPSSASLIYSRLRDVLIAINSVSLVMLPAARP